MPHREDHPDRETSHLESQRRLERFEEALRRWAQRPAPPPPPWPVPRSSRSGARPAAPRWQLVAASLAVAAVLAVGALLRWRAAPPNQTPTAAPASAPVAAVASADEVLVLWLDPDTPLYLTLPAAEAAVTERSTR
jgi:anti-sigma-K factor RskA